MYVLDIILRKEHNITVTTNKRREISFLCFIVVRLIEKRFSPLHIITLCNIIEVLLTINR